jgi:hypothetical protein
MRTAAIALFALSLPVDARAQVDQLTLNCNYDSAAEPLKAGTEAPTSGGFSAIVRMLPGQIATIEATILRW